MTLATSWWHGPAGHFYNCLVDDPSETPPEQQMFEIAVHSVAPPGSTKEKKFSWGIPATNERVESHFKVRTLSLSLNLFGSFPKF